MGRLDEIAIELSKLHDTISKWCMAMAWPGKAPTPPFAAWDRQAELYEELRSLGVEKPKYFRMKHRTTTAEGDPAK